MVVAEYSHSILNPVSESPSSPPLYTVFSFVQSSCLSEQNLIHANMHFTFPAISPFLELVQHAQDIPDKIIVRDHYSNRTATAGELLQSVASLREQIQTSQQQNGTSSNGVTSNGISTNGTNGTNGISASQNKFYYLIAAPGLEYLTSMLTIFSLGGVMSAQCKSALFTVPMGYAHNHI